MNDQEKYDRLLDECGAPEMEPEPDADEIVDELRAERDALKTEVGLLRDRISSAIAWAKDGPASDVPPQYDTYREGVRTAKHRAIQLLRDDARCAHPRWTPSTNACPDCSACEYQ